MSNFYLNFIKKNIYGFVVGFGFCGKNKQGAPNEKVPIISNTNCMLSSVSEVMKDNVIGSSTLAHIAGLNPTASVGFSDSDKGEQSRDNSFQTDAHPFFQFQQPITKEICNDQTFGQKKPNKKDNTKQQEQNKKKTTLELSYKTETAEKLLEYEKERKRIKKQKQNFEEESEKLKEEPVSLFFLSDEKHNNEKKDFFCCLKHFTQSLDPSLEDQKKDIISNVIKLKKKMIDKKIQKIKKKNIALFMESISFAVYKKDLKSEKLKKKIEKKQKKTEGKKKNNLARFKQIREDYNKVTFYDILFWAQILQIFKKTNKHRSFESVIETLFPEKNITSATINEIIEDFIENSFLFIKKEQKEMEDSLLAIKEKNDKLKNLLTIITDPTKAEKYLKILGKLSLSLQQTSEEKIRMLELDGIENSVIKTVMKESLSTILQKNHNLEEIVRTSLLENILQKPQVDKKDELKQKIKDLETLDLEINQHILNHKNGFFKLKDSIYFKLQEIKEQKIEPQLELVLYIFDQLAIEKKEIKKEKKHISVKYDILLKEQETVFLCYDYLALKKNNQNQ